MRGTPFEWGEPAIEQTGAREVEHCPCGSPVVRAPGAMQAHIQRCHNLPAPAPVMPNVRRWEMQWR